MFDHQFDLQGHRGARGLFPENTLEGFTAAMRMGLRSFEIDIAITRDGVPVVHHDPHLNPDLARGPDGRWLDERGPLLHDLTLAELQVYDVGRIKPGSRYAALYATQVPHDGARIPTLEALLQLDPELRFNIELKLLPNHPDWTVSPEEMVERVLAVIDREGASHRVMIQSFDWRAPTHARRVRPDIKRGWLTRPDTVAAGALWLGQALDMASIPLAIARAGGGTWTPFHTELTPTLLEQAHRLGLKVIPWTVNQPADLRRVIDLGADGVISDWPDRALKLLPV